VYRRNTQTTTHAPCVVLLDVKYNKSFYERLSKTELCNYARRISQPSTWIAADIAGDIVNLRNRSSLPQPANIPSTTDPAHTYSLAETLVKVALFWHSGITSGSHSQNGSMHGQWLVCNLVLLLPLLKSYLYSEYDLFTNLLTTPTTKRIIMYVLFAMRHFALLSPQRDASSDVDSARILESLVQIAIKNNQHRSFSRKQKYSNSISCIIL